MMRLGAKALISSYSARVWARVSVVPLPLLVVGVGVVGGVDMGAVVPPLPLGVGVDVGLGVGLGVGIPPGGPVDGGVGFGVTGPGSGGPGGACAAAAVGQATARKRANM